MSAPDIDESTGRSGTLPWPGAGVGAHPCCAPTYVRDTIVLFEPARPRLKPGFLRQLGALTEADFQGFAAGLQRMFDVNSQPKGSSTIT